MKIIKIPPSCLSLLIDDHLVITLEEVLVLELFKPIGRGFLGCLYATEHENIQLTALKRKNLVMQGTSPRCYRITAFGKNVLTEVLEYRYKSCQRGKADLASGRCPPRRSPTTRAADA